MTKAKKGLLSICVAVLVVIMMAVLYGCNEKKDDREPYFTSGHGSVVENVEEDGRTTYTAVADEWNVFTGWYNGLELFSNKATIEVDKKTPKELVAKFETSGMLSIDRVLNGSYFLYSDATSVAGEYLNAEFDATISVTGDGINTSLTSHHGGYASLDGKGFNEFELVKEGDDVVFARYYTDDAQNAMLYLDFDGRKVAVEDFESIGKKLFELPNIGSQIWKLKDIVSNNIYSVIDSYAGFRNAVGFIKSVENAPSQTKITLNIDELLNELKDKISSLNGAEWEKIKQVVEMLTSEYSGIATKLPDITLSLAIDYSTDGNNERIEKVALSAQFAEEYKLAIKDQLISIPACTINYEITNANFSLSQTPNAVPAEVIAEFPDAVHAINVHADGKFSFLKQNVATLEFDKMVEEYTIEFDTDIDLDAVKDAFSQDEFDASKIDWDNFGLLSLRILLSDPSHASNHNGSSEYLNILIDTTKFGSQAFVSIDLYNPKTMDGMATSKYILRGAYDLEELFRIMPQIADNLENFGTQPQVAGASVELSEENIVANLIATSVKSARSMIYQNQTADEILFDLILTLIDQFAPNNQLLQEGISYSHQFGTTLAVDEIKDLIKEEFAEANSTLSSLGLQNTIFGKDASHIAVKIDNALYGGVIKNKAGEYVDQNSKSFAEEYNGRHKMLVGVADDGIVNGIDDVTFDKANIQNQIDNLGSVIVTKGLFSDGSTQSTFENCQGNQAEIAMKVYSANYQMIDDNRAEITVYLSFATGTLQGLMVNTFGLPYALIEYSTVVTLA